MAGMTCPQCGSPMVLRTKRADGSKFWGCSAFPTCRKTMDWREEVVQTKAFVPSKYQEAIFQYIQDPNGTDAVVEAVAGSGKTTTLVQALQFTKGRVAFVAFNKKIAEELARKAPPHVQCSTLHSLGFKAICKNFPNKPQVDEDKKFSISKELMPADDDAYVRPVLVRLASLVQATLADENDALALDELMDQYDLDANGQEARVISLVPEMIRLCKERTSVIDYDDMIWLPVVLRLPVEQYDWLFVDELQDVNRSQAELIMMSVNEFGRIIGVGDRYQSIYGFRGADTQAIPRMIERLNECKVLPLSITYRCPVEHVKLARQLVPHIEAAETAIPGTIVYDMPVDKVTGELQSGDMVLCRCNGPLVEMVYSLIRIGKKATIVGRDIGKGLVQLIDKLKPTSINDLMSKLAEYRAKEIQRLVDFHREQRIAALEDKVDCLEALCDGIDDLTTLRARINSIFTDEQTGISLSSVHRAKGLEAKNVFILKPSLMPHPKATSEWAQEQERNIKYVAYTRSKERLVFIRES